MSLSHDFLDIFYGRDEFTNFGAQLLRLIAKADRDNLERLRLAFPAQVEMYEWWMEQPDPPMPDAVIKKADELEAK